MVTLYSEQKKVSQQFSMVRDALNTNHVMFTVIIVSDSEMLETPIVMKKSCN